MTAPDSIDLPLYQLAHARTGDKGNRINISVICYRQEAYPYLVDQMTEARVLACFAHREPTAVQRYLLPNIAAINFVIDEVLGGGVNSSLYLDRHGKGLSFLLLSEMVQAPRSCSVAS
ncbi:hypothetical protein [Hydrogenophaga sp. 5NK40-0174]|uniref:AtuA-related protein n=1 Tax=Hydrogenophaga sp. 5NK40-0174 TaxID=3127649 RepID=UPI003105206A